MRMVAMVWIAWFSVRSPPRLSRWRFFSPLLASAGMRERHDHLGCADRADPPAVGQAGGQVVDDGSELGAVGFEFAATVTQPHRQATNLGLAHGLFACRVARRPAPRELIEGAVVELAPRQVPVGVVPVAQ